MAPDLIAIISCKPYIVCSVSGSSSVSALEILISFVILFTPSASSSISSSVSMTCGYVPVLVTDEVLRGSSVDLNLWPSLTIVLL